MLNYEDIYCELVNSSSNNLLLGSGFSMAYKKTMGLNEGDYLNNNLSDKDKEKYIRLKNDRIKRRKYSDAVIFKHERG